MSNTELKDVVAWGVKMWTKMLVACAALVGLTGLAGAADANLPPPAPLYVSTWTGCYIGGHAGYGKATATSYYSSPASAELDVNGFFIASTLIQKFDNKGFAGGGQVGCQQQIGWFLWGVEADWSSFRNSDSRSFAGGFDEGGGVTFSQTFNQSLSFSSMWSVRARFGAVLSGVYHVYATAGVGGAKADYAYAASFSEIGGGPCLCAAIARTIGITPTGFVFGVGAEWRLWSNLVIGAEYLRYALASDTIVPFSTSSLDPLIALGGHVHINSVDVVRVRASWLFNLAL